MLMQTKSIKDQQLLWLTGFLKNNYTGPMPTTTPDIDKICAFFAVSEQTVKRWLKTKFPPKARHQLEMIYAGDSLPPTWRKAGLKVCDDGVLLADGRLVRLGTIQFWPFLMQAVDWNKVPKLVIERST